MLSKNVVALVLLLITLCPNNVRSEHSEYFQQILDKLQAADNSVNAVRESVTTDQAAVSSQLTQLVKDINSAKDDALNSIQGVDSKLSGAQQALGESITGIDSQVRYPNVLCIIYCRARQYSIQVVDWKVFTAVAIEGINKSLMVY